MSAIRSMLFVVSVLSAGCGGSPAPHGGEPVRLGKLGFEVPEGWQRSDFRQPGTLISVWAPSPGNNPRKESITVIESEQIVSHLDDTKLQKLLSGSQSALRDARSSRVTPVVTELGLRGYRLDVEFTPQHSPARYRRSHIVLHDGGRLVHVIYTAKTPDPEREALETVIGTVRHAEASS